MKKSITVTLFTLLVIVTALAGCSSKSAKINCPFTDLSWEDAVEEMIALEGDGYDTYDSIYHGLTYTYPKEYLGKGGMIKYMYDDTGRLCNVSWSYTGVDAEELMTVYHAVVDEMTKLHGKSKNDDGVGNFGETWITDKGTVMANAVVTNDTKVMQIAYMSPEVSKQKQ